jgi:hypothetical protein
MEITDHKWSLALSESRIIFYIQLFKLQHIE